MNILITAYIFFIGAALGSFALVVAERWNTKRSWVKGRSQCDSCKQTLHSIDLIPIVSWVFSKGNCRYCGKKMSVRYPLSEFASGATLLLVFIFFPYEISLFSVGFYLFLLWLIAHTLVSILVLIDFRHMIMPYTFLFPLIVTSVLFRLIILFNSSTEHPSVASLLIGVLIGGGIFASLWYISRGKWIGDSDIFLGIAIAFIVGGVLEVWIAFFVASLAGLFYGTIFSTLRGKKLHNMKIPFGPFLVSGMIVSLLFSSVIISTYMDMFLLY